MKKSQILDYLTYGESSPNQNAVELLETMFEHYLESCLSKDMHRMYQLKKYLQSHMMQDDCDIEGVTKPSKPKSENQQGKMIEL